MRERRHRRQERLDGLLHLAPLDVVSGPLGHDLPVAVDQVGGRNPLDAEGLPGGIGRIIDADRVADLLVDDVLDRLRGVLID